MNKKSNLQKNLKFHCFKCQTLYQLMEVHSQAKQTCPDNCLTKWQSLCHGYYKEKILAYLALQEEENEKAAEKLANWPDWLKKPTK
jgi:hypothetical protein